MESIFQAVLAPAALFLAVVLEGPLATAAAGALAQAGVLAWVPVLLIVVLADLTADSGYYLAGRLLHRPGIRRLLRRVGIALVRHQQVTRSVTSRLPATLAGIKVADMAAVPVLLMLGAARVDYGRFLFWNAVVTIPRAGLLLLVGALLGPAAGQLADRVGPALVLLFLLPLSAVAIVAVARRTPTQGVTP